MTTTIPRATACDRIRWQREALDLMTAAIGKGAKAKLEPLMWQLGAHGCAGTVSTAELTLAEQESLLRAWATVLDLGEVRRVEIPVGIVRCIAQDRTSADWIPHRIAIAVDLVDWDEAPEPG
jgi:hypothetical protein